MKKSRIRIISRRLLPALPAIVLALLPLTARAEFITGIASAVVSMFAFVLNYVIGMIAGVFFTLGGYFINLGIGLNATVLSSDIVKIGFGITLQTTNLGFVLAIIVIAFATILRMESYGLKKMLGKLILAAFLINFSLTAAGLIIDFAGVISNYFIDRSTGTGTTLSINRAKEFATVIGGAFKPQKNLDIQGQDIIESVAENTAEMLQAVMSIFFTATFTLIAAVALIGIGIMILIRYVALAILLILMPFAWLGLVMPGLGGWWGKWWSNFLKWVLFLPATLFFFYLTVMSFKYIKDQNTLAVSGFGQNDVGVVTGSLQQYGEMMVVLGLLVASLLVGPKLGHISLV